MSTTLPARIRRSLAAGARAIALLTDEEDRAIAVLEKLGDEHGWVVHTWSLASGADGSRDDLSLDELLTRLVASREDSLWIILDAHRAGPSARTVRAIREHAQRTSGPALVLVGSGLGAIGPVPELVVEHLPVADRDELASQVRWIGDTLEEAGHEGAAAILADSAPAVARAAVGLPLRTLDRLVAEAIDEYGLDADAIVGFVGDAKPDALDSGGLLTRVDSTAVEELGGLGELKSWLSRRSRALEPAARQAAIPDPRGVLLVGVQGCGKSLAARVCASVLGLPLVRLEPGRLFGGTVGESEANLRRVTETADRIAPLVLWIDEIDKGLAGVEGSASDAGTTARVVGGLLTWLQERERPVFVVATANRVDFLPPELLRRGRLDEVFFVDLPSAEERAAILRIHLQTVPRRVFGHVPEHADDVERFEAAARRAEGFSGAELEGALVEARLAAYAEGRPLASGDLEAALAATVPLSRTRAETIEGLRRWASTRARRA